MNQDDESSGLKQGDLPAYRIHVAAQLRAMASAAGEYKRFTYISPEIKAVWLAAADLLEERPGQ